MLTNQKYWNAQPLAECKFAVCRKILEKLSCHIRDDLSYALQHGLIPSIVKCIHTPDLKGYSSTSGDLLASHGLCHEDVKRIFFRGEYLPSRIGTSAVSGVVAFPK